MKAYNSLIKNKKNLKISEIKAKEIFSLPLFPEMKISEVDKVCFNLKKILTKI